MSPKEASEGISVEMKEYTKDSVLVLELSGSLQSETDAVAMRDKMNACVDRKQVHLVLDIAGLRYVNSWGLGLLVALLSMMRRAGGDVRIAKLGNNTHNLFIVTRLSEVFQMYEHVDAAVASFRSPRK